MDLRYKATVGLWLTGLAALCLLAFASVAGSGPAAPPTCANATAALSFDHRYAIGSGDFSDPDGDPESGSTFRWLVVGSPVAAGQVAEGGLLHFGGLPTGANGEMPDQAQGVAYEAGKWGQALALAPAGSLYFDRENDLTGEGTIELWVALRADGDDPVYNDRWHVLFLYQAPNGDSLWIALAEDSGILYAGGSVDGQWQSVYGSLGDMRGWTTGEWHHLAFTYSAAGNITRFYVDGLLAADINEGHYWSPPAWGSDFYVGGNRWNEEAYYLLDEVRLSGRAATGDEIVARAQRLDPPRANEFWVAPDSLAAGDELVHEFTPAACGKTGAPCSSPPLLYPGIPVPEPNPLSTLLPGGATPVSLSVRSSEATTCAYALGEILARLFNGISIGLATANVLEGEEAFGDLLARYHDWLRQAAEPATTMIESSPLDDIAYGSDYELWNKIPAATLELARTYYPWMRFGLALTLLDDGYITHEFSDTRHGSDWWYDELDFDLGYPLRPAERVDLGGPPPENLVENGGFEDPIVRPWSFWANAGADCLAAVCRDTGDAALGEASAHIILTTTSGIDWHVEFAQYDRSLEQGVAYDLTSWARSDAPRTITLSAQKGSPDWDNYGLWQRVPIDTGWQEYTVSFEANATVDDSRLQFLLGEMTGTAWLDGVRLNVRPPDVYRRQFDHGLVLLNDTRQPQAVEVGPGYRRPSAGAPWAQAPRYETILNDADAGFSTTGTWTDTSYDSGEWQASGLFYHDWGAGCHESSGVPAEARWSLPILATNV